MKNPPSFLFSTFELAMFFASLWTGFQLIFFLSSFPSAWINTGIVFIHHWLEVNLAESAWSSFLSNGVLGGVGATLLFLPQILLLFLFLEVIRESGYLRKNSRLLGKVMRHFGLGSESVPPLLMGFGCNVPAIMAVRQLPEKKERIITALMIPFMSCSARLPVYTLLTAAFFAGRWQGTVLFAIYLLGLLMGMITGVVLNGLLRHPHKHREFIETRMHFPRPGKVFKAGVRVTVSFFWKIGRVILPASIIMWALFAYPQSSQTENDITQTYGARIGMFVAPIFEPLGFNWQISTALLSGAAAKETVVSTLGVFHSLEHGSDPLTLAEHLRDPDFLTTPAALALLVFVLLYVPCVGVFAALKQELGLGWALAGLFYPTILAWIMAFMVYRIGILFF